jgi:hypothetical protein
MELVNMNARLTNLVKDKLDRPYWELIASIRNIGGLTLYTHLAVPLALELDGLFLNNYIKFNALHSLK